MGEHAYPDTQPPGSHLDPRCNIQKYTMDQLTAYWAMVYTLALIAGIAGDEDEKKAARDAVKQALSDAAETIGDYGKAAQIVVDDYVPPSPFTLPYTSEGSWVREQIGRGIESFFGFDTKDNDQRIEALDQQIRDKTAVQVNRAAGIRKTVKGVFGWDTSAEDAAIAQTQQTVNARNAEVSAAFDRLWNGIQEIALSRYNQFTKERDACGVGYALQTLGVDAGFVVVETVVTVAAGAVTAGAGAVALRVSVHAGKTVGKIVVKISRAGRVARRVTPNEGTLRLEESKVVEFGKKHNGYGDDQGGHPIVKADQEPGGPNINAGAGTRKLTRGRNENEITYDPKTGRPIAAKGTLREDFGSTVRGDNATAVGKLGNPGDHGGHLVAHRFMGDTPDHGIAPQAGNLNTGAWKTMENEWADWIKKGYEIDYNINVYPPGSVRPDLFRATYSVRDPKTGQIKYQNTNNFRNRPGETFDRVAFRDME